ncbi:hypothetical protein A1O1_01916 [Capronia coronata CBS 617.96]|uniref:KANL3/Tex30 alpha/beta hydrolase-like domain-containing protein n=1 Tax=Capronia coronata CBS 617.96 TaxID=1182541 RepID=W9ZG98_9EURO|nr:uncharacterized protein A1O1_01916 [Capronia coronata CBS 617.96]EXJ93524.1 hypothetical protein A1O1_01916 [Capronia coronata CBS 617.96]
MAPKRRSARVAESDGSRKKVKVSTTTSTSPPLPQSSSPPSPASAVETASASKSAIDASSHAAPAAPETDAVTSAPSLTFTSYEVPSKSMAKPISCLRSHPPSSPPVSLIFTHGAGGGLSAPAMTNFCHGFASTGTAIACFQGPMNLPGRAGMFATVLNYEYEKQQTGKTPELELEGAQLAFGGRSMGARAAVMAAHSDKTIDLLILVSYPLVAPSGDVRDQILLDIRPDTEVLFVSGDGDSMCDLARLAKVRAKMKAKTWMVVVKGADHGMNLKGGAKLKKATEEVGKETGRIAATWIQRRDGTSTTREMVLKWDPDRQRVLGQWGHEQAATAHDNVGGPAEKGGIKRYFAKTEIGTEGDEAEITSPKAKRKKEVQ